MVNTELSTSSQSIERLLEVFEYKVTQDSEKNTPVTSCKGDNKTVS